ncbi:MAG: FecR family protein [Betaproteobacteria bacterium]
MQMKRWLWIAILAALGLAGTGAESAEPAARATGVSGVVIIERTGGGVKFAAEGSAMEAGDTLRTEASSQARLDFADGTQVLLRPQSVFKIEKYRYNEAKPQEDGALMRLFKGGLRAVTGLIGKHRPDSMLFGTSTATIGIRGTDFIVRVCGDECAAETKRAAKADLPPSPGFAGRVMTVQGQLRVDRGGGPVPLAVGATFYAGDVLITAPSTWAALLFRDGMRVVLKADTRFLVDTFRYEAAAPERGSAILRLLRGSLRAVTGLVARRNPSQVQFGTAVATIGIRGTGLDMRCTGPCASEAPTPADELDGLATYTWKGCTVMLTEQGNLDLCEGQSGQVKAPGDAPRRFDSVPRYFLDDTTPRPDTMDGDTDAAFGPQNEEFSPPGTYVYVRDGAVILRGGTEQDIARGEVGYLDQAGRFSRLAAPPLFIDRDPVLRYMDSDASMSCTVR